MAYEENEDGTWTKLRRAETINKQTLINETASLRKILTELPSRLPYPIKASEELKQAVDMWNCMNVDDPIKSFNQTILENNKIIRELK